MKAKFVLPVIEVDGKYEANIFGLDLTRLDSTSGSTEMAIVTVEGSSQSINALKTKEGVTFLGDVIEEE